MKEWVVVNWKILSQLERGELALSKEIALLPSMEFTTNEKGQLVGTTYPVRDFIRYLEGNKSVTQLGIRGFNISLEDARELARILPTTNISSLLIGGQEEVRIEAEAMEIIAEALQRSQVSYLRIDSFNIGQQGVEALARHLGNTKLKDLSLWNNNIGEQGACLIIENLPPTLNDLGIIYENIGAGGFEALRRILLKSALKKLILNNIQMGAEGARVIAEALPASLTHLEVEGNNLGVEGAEILAPAIASRPITILNVSDNDLGSLGGKIIVEALEGKEVESLGIARNNIGVEQFSMFASALSHKSIKQLGLEENNIEASNINKLASVLPTMPVKGLFLDGNNIGDNGASVLARALPETPINEVSLEECSMQSEGLKAIANIIRLGKITDLKISDNNIDDSFLAVLADALGDTNTRISEIELGCILTQKIGDKIASSIESNPFITYIYVGLNLVFESHKKIEDICQRNKSFKTTLSSYIEVYERYKDVRVEIGSEDHKKLNEAAATFLNLLDYFKEDMFMRALNDMYPNISGSSLVHFYGRIMPSITGVVKHMALYSAPTSNPDASSSVVEDSSEELTPAKLVFGNRDIIARIFSYLTPKDIMPSVISSSERQETDIMAKMGDVNIIGEES